MICDKYKFDHIVFAQSDAMATICFITEFLRLLFESGYYSRVAFVELVNPDRMEDEEINCL